MACATFGIARRRRHLIACAVLVAGASATRGADTSWNTNSSGFFNVAGNWSNGVPTSADTANFSRGAAINYAVTFPGNSRFDPDAQYYSDRLVVGSNTVSFVGSSNPGTGRSHYTLTTNVNFLDERGIVMGFPNSTSILNVSLASISSNAATIGEYSGSNAALNLNAGTFNITAPHYTAGDALMVGDYGSGSLNISNGAHAVITAEDAIAWFGWQPESSGTLTVIGPGSRFDDAGGLRIGVRGRGELTISGGAQVTSVGGGVGGSSAVAIISGAASSWNVAGGFGIGAVGTGVLTVENGGRLSSTESTIGAGGGSDNTIVVRDNGSRWDNNGNLDMGSGGKATLKVEAGGIVISDDVFLTAQLGQAIITGTNSTWTNHIFSIGIGVNGDNRLTIDAGGKVASFRSTISGGQASVNGVGSTWENTENLYVGSDYGPGSLTIASNAHFSAGGIFVGSVYSGTVLITEAGDAVSGSASIANGAVTVDGAGSRWNLGGGLAMAGSGQDATLTITNGALVDSGDISDGGAGISTITLDGGTLDMHNNRIGGVSHIDNLNFLSGTLRNVKQINDGIGLTKTSTGTLILDGDNTYSGTTMVAAGTLVFKTNYTKGTAIDVADGAVAGVASSAQTPHDVVLRTAVVNSHTSGKLDLMDNRLVVIGQDVPTITAMVRSAYHGGAWDGPGITTSLGDSGHALGIALAEEVGLDGSTFAGVPVSAGDVLVRYTRAGDLNLDGTVSIADFLDLASHFNTIGGATWRMGDVNYDGLVTISDFLDLAGNYGQSVTGGSAPVSESEWAMLSSFAAVNVPERFTLAPAALAIFFVRRRRRISQ